MSRKPLRSTAIIRTGTINLNQARISNPFGNYLLMYIARRDFFLSGEASRVYTFLTIAVSDRIFLPAPGRNQ